VYRIYKILNYHGKNSKNDEGVFQQALQNKAMVFFSRGVQWGFFRIRQKCTFAPMNSANHNSTAGKPRQNRLSADDNIANIGILASGRGSHFRNLHQACQKDRIPARIAWLISNNSRCGAMEYAREQGIPAFHLSAKTHPEDSQRTAEMIRVAEEFQTSLICLAGYMKALPSQLIQTYPKRILNIHPSLLPEFGGKGCYGIKVHQMVIEAGKVQTGATVHLVEGEYDRGMILAQERVPVKPGDTPEILAARVLEAEHLLYETTIRNFLKSENPPTI